ncbi:thioredoxin family protein [Microbacterium sp.]|uniref:TlpA family protein disulfide reductase n=1 Tax=Microbacterium sp. TaxID=51671 RepID=UPI0026285385|nr:thioredoxin family protein [Microbacterium sp.]
MPLSTALLLTGAVLVLALGAGLVLRMLDGRRRTGHQLRLEVADLDGATLAPGATLVQFSTEFCTRCPQVRRLIGVLADERSGVTNVEIDLTDRRDLAARYRVLQTPTTFLVDSRGIVRFRWGGVPARDTINDALDTMLRREPVASTPAVASTREQT